MSAVRRRPRARCGRGRDGGGCDRAQPQIIGEAVKPPPSRDHRRVPGDRLAADPGLPQHPRPPVLRGRRGHHPRCRERPPPPACRGAATPPRGAVTSAAGVAGLDHRQGLDGARATWREQTHLRRRATRSGVPRDDRFRCCAARHGNHRSRCRRRRSSAICGRHAGSGRLNGRKLCVRGAKVVMRDVRAIPSRPRQRLIVRAHP